MNSRKARIDSESVRRLISKLENSDEGSVPKLFQTEMKLLHGGVRIPIHNMFRGETYGELVDYTRWATNLNERQFNRGRKSIQDLFDEYMGFDIGLTAEKGMGLQSLRASARTLYMVPNEGLALLETRRTYEDGKPPLDHPEPQPHTCKETVKREDEDDLDAAIRGWWEEYRRRMAREMLQRCRHWLSIEPSTVYRRTTSNTLVCPFIWESDTMLWPKGKVVVDGKTRIHHEWKPIPKKLPEKLKA